MSDERNRDDLDKLDFAQLKRVLRSLEDREAPEWHRPSEDAIWAYLLDTASDAQREEALQALAGSSAFRKELLAMAEDLEFSRSQEAATAFEKVVVPEIPAWVRGKPESPDSRTNAPAAEAVTWWTRFSAWVAPRRTAVAMAGAFAVLVVMVGIYLAVRKPSTSHEWSGIRIAQADWVDTMRRYAFTPSVVRGGGERIGETEAPAVLALDAREAAELAFVDRIVVEDDEWKFLPLTPGIGSEPPVTTASHCLALLDAEGAEFFKTCATIPSPAENVETWIIGLPSRNVYRAPMVGDSAKVKWDPQTDTKGCVTFSYQLAPDKFAATPAVSFEIKR